MLGIDDGFFIEGATQSTTRVLHPAKILGIENGAYTAQIEEAGVSLDKGAEFQFYFETPRDFMKQAAIVQAVQDDEPTAVIEFVTVGEPVSAESRQHFRVSTVMAGMTATLGRETGCKLLNVSTVGFCVLASVRYDIGSTLDASVLHNDMTYSGKSCVQSIRSMDKDQIRYGLHGVDMNGFAGNLQTGLRHITTTIQREQLRRLSVSG